MDSSAKTKVGNSYWYILQNMPGSMQDPPTESEQGAFLEFLEASSLVYPCRTCRPGFEWVRIHPPVFVSRSTLEQWICDFHNTVNAHLGHAQFNCATLKTESCSTCEIVVPQVQKSEFAQLL